MNLREVAEENLALPMRDWGESVTLVDPDGVSYSVVGQVFCNSIRLNPDTGDEVSVYYPRIKLRRSTLARIPLAGETWYARVSVSPGGSAEDFMLDPTRPPESGKAMGYIILYLRKAIQI